MKFLSCTCIHTITVELSEFSQTGHTYVNSIQIKKQNLTGPHQVPSSHCPQENQYLVF